MPKTGIHIISRQQGNNRAIKAGEVALPDFALEWEEVDPLVRAFRKMVREGAYEVTELALTTYICARAHGAELTAIPVFLVRDFHHKAAVRRVGGSITTPRNVIGKRVGVQRGYTVTTGVWARAVLAEEHGVEPETVTWARSDVEHVASYAPPTFVEDLGGTGDVAAQIAAGTLDAGVGLGATGDHMAPLIENPGDAGLRAFRERGFYPINHLVAIRNDVLAANPGLATQLFEGFAQSKRRYVAALRAGQIANPTAIDKVHSAVMETQPDPLPYGIAPNQDILERLMSHAVAQGIIPAPVPLTDLFAPEVLELVG
ncbi:hypothetical protein [Puniceibacterium sp. IMCC21224]|uniref:hypothetical protein n=1 Tax=Puniceibacterium sp. IMCC21224 TaxID=1618204 RepID=UPI00064D93EB|nr:hypothetical protein [Puniceibacterium sp. IMCC21224]KMK65023.1 4,5-dihydroxyphthalate decarboxylase [Puniceibacterium sp. IMCC21224]